MMTHKPLPNHLMEELGLRPKRSTLFPIQNQYTKKHTCPFRGTSLARQSEPQALHPFGLRRRS